MESSGSSGGDPRAEVRGTDEDDTLLRLGDESVSGEDQRDEAERLDMFRGHEVAGGHANGEAAAAPGSVLEKKATGWRGEKGLGFVRRLERVLI